MNTSGMERSFYKNYFEIERTHWLMRVKRSLVGDMLIQYGITSPDVVLDFGCGSGYLVDRLRANGFVSHGADISAEAIKLGQLKGIHNLSVVDSHKLHYGDASFDAVLALDVLEHLEDEEWALTEIERVLKPGGVCITVVPAYQFLWGIQDKVSHHYRRYTRSGLLKKIQNTTHFDVIKSTYFNTLLFVPIVCVRLFSKLFPVHRHSDFDLNNTFLNKVLFTIFNIERTFLSWMSFPFGVSVMVVLKKKL